ncbi:hypothetical protein DRJ17_07285, partial [Candidatus Woesearchaeota archaeon]
MVGAKKALCTVFIVLILLSSTITILTTPLVQAGAEYYVPITVKELSGTNLSDYQIKIVLNSTNFMYWSHIVSANGSDIYFTDSLGNPLYYWIEYFNVTEQEATIWVKVPQIPANGETIIYMYYGGDNPYTDYNDPSQVFDYFDDFSTLKTYNVEPGIFDGGEGTFTVSEGVGVGKVSSEGHVIIYPNVAVKNRFAIRCDCKDLDTAAHSQVGIALKGSSEELWFKQVDNDVVNVFIDEFSKATSVGVTQLWTRNIITDTEFHKFELRYADGVFKLLKDGVEIASVSYSLAEEQYYIAMFMAFNESSELHFDNFILRKYVDPEPSYEIGFETVAIKKVKLPSDSLLLIHEITYSPNSTQFSHSFTATNATVAGYETNYTDAYGWRVYANPYQSGGVNYENLVSLVSEVNITLPYSEVLVENVTLLAKTNGTGSLRQLWVKVLNSTGGVVAELTNATIGTDWAEVFLAVNANLSNQITVWINATVKSITTIGEEIGIKDVRVYAKYNTNPQISAPWEPNVDYFNCSASHYVDLGSTEHLNSSVITFKLVQYLIFNTTEYPVQPVYVGNETIGSYNYTVYRIDPANYSQYLAIYALLENRFKTFRTHAKGYDTETILIGEPLTVELPEIGNITIVELNKTYTNVLSVSVRFNETGIFIIETNLTKASLWRLGYGKKAITVKYGAFSVKPLDIDSKVINYENIVLQLVNGTGYVVGELIGNQLFSFDNLWGGNYSLVAKFKDIVIADTPFELNITTDNSTANLPCAMKSLARDYRGLNRSVILEHDKQLLSVENVSSKYPFSRMRILLNGIGMFKLYINYRGDLPTKVTVVGNVTNLNYYWDGNYLVITGTLDSVGELNVIDLYRLKIEIYDRFGNYMPSWIYAYVNSTKYVGAVVEDYFYPEDYVVKLPSSINGFEFYGFFDGYNESTRVVTINHTDVEFKAWYRVPTSIVEFKSFQITSLGLIPFIRQE